MDGQFDGLTGTREVGCRCGKGLGQVRQGGGRGVGMRIELNGDVLATGDHFAPVTRREKLACTREARLLIGDDET